MSDPEPASAHVRSRPFEQCDQPTEALSNVTHMAAWRSIRAPRLLGRIGPLLRAPIARSMARPAAGGNGIKTILVPLPHVAAPGGRALRPGRVAAQVYLCLLPFSTSILPGPSLICDSRIVLSFDSVTGSSAGLSLDALGGCEAQRILTDGADSPTLLSSCDLVAQGAV